MTPTWFSYPVKLSGEAASVERRLTTEDWGGGGAAGGGGDSDKPAFKALWLA